MPTDVVAADARERLDIDRRAHLGDRRRRPRAVDVPARAGGDRRGARPLPAAAGVPAVGRRAAAPRAAQARRGARGDAAADAAGARRPGASVGARAARRDVDGPGHRRRARRALQRRARARVPLRRRGLRPADGRGARVRHAGRRLRGAGRCARSSATAPRSSRSATWRACSRPPRRATRPAPAPPAWTWTDAARSTWATYAAACAQPALRTRRVPRLPRGAF